MNQAKDYVGQTVTIGAWVTNKRSSGKIAFLQLRDGKAYFQGIKCEKPKGAFYLFVNVKVAMHIVGVASSEEFALKLLEEAGVATVSGENFGCNGFLRLSCANSEEELREAANRIKEFIESYK